MFPFRAAVAGLAFVTLVKVLITVAVIDRGSAVG